MAFWSKKDGKGTPEPAAPPSAPAAPVPVAAPPPVVEQQAATPLAPVTPAAPAKSASAPPAGSFRPDERMAMEFGKMAIILLGSQRHRALPLGDLFAQVAPAMLAGQYVMAMAKPEGKEVSEPVALIMWASVSDEVDRRLAGSLSTPMLLTPPDWKSGPHVWIVDAVGPSKLVEAMLNQLAAGPLKDRGIKLRRKTEAGDVTVQQWPVAA